jgi:hypothetical protein
MSKTCEIRELAILLEQTNLAWTILAKGIALYFTGGTINRAYLPHF